MTFERLELLVNTVASNLGRSEVDGDNDLVVFHFVYGFLGEFAWRNSNNNLTLQAKDIPAEEFHLLVEVFRKLARQMPDAFRVDEAVINATDYSGKVVGWHDMGATSKYIPVKIGDPRPNPFTVAIKEVLKEQARTS